MFKGPKNIIQILIIIIAVLVLAILLYCFIVNKAIPEVEQQITDATEQMFSGE